MEGLGYVAIKLDVQVLLNGDLGIALLAAFVDPILELVT
jgi:hypothetical protein